MTTSGAETLPIPFAAAPADRRLRLALRLAGRIRVGTLTIVLPDGSTHRLAATPLPAASMIIRDPRAVTRLAFGGDLGFAEAYLDGMWDSPSLREVMALATANEAAWEALLRGRPAMRALAWLAHLLRPNTRAGARRNIAAHYDLGNDFYALWLDPTMTYSAALFAAPGMDLAAAQTAKMHRLARALDLRPGMRLLEIGCGWGGFAELAARDYGVSVLGITLSRAQLDHARARIEAAGLGTRVTLRLRDYREVTGRFDRIVSIEMLEAVGERFWPVYFATLHDRLAPGGLAALQTITIADRLFAAYRRSADFVQRHVFPGGMLPAPARLRAEAARAGLVWRTEHWFGADYAETLARWHAAFDAAWPRITCLSGRYDARFRRLWSYYLHYCEAGFRAGWTDVGQIVLARPG